MYSRRINNSKHHKSLNRHSGIPCYIEKALSLCFSVLERGSARLQVEIFHPGQDRTYYFPCDRWLEKSKVSGMEGCRATLEPSAQGLGGEDGELVQYRVTVHTTDCRGAGTDSDVSCVVYGELGDTGTQSLDSSKNDFERGQVRACLGWADPSTREDRKITHPRLHAYRRVSAAAASLHDSCRLVCAVDLSGRSVEPETAFG